MTFTVMSWNLSDFELTARPDKRQRAQLRYIADAAPDVFCCQKLTGHRSPDKVNDGFRALGSELGMMGRLARLAGPRMHVAILWRRGITEAGPWTPLGEMLHRNAAVTTLLIDSDYPLRVGTVHLPSGSVEDRLADVEHLLAFGDAAVPTVLAGDWNSVGEDPTCDPDSPTHSFDRQVATKLAASGLTDAALHLRVPWASTWDEDGWPRIRIDGFRVTEPVLPALCGYAVDQGVDDLSHHRPVRLFLDIDRLPKHRENRRSSRHRRPHQELSQAVSQPLL